MFVFDVLLFVIAYINPELLAFFNPQVIISNGDYSYARLVGIFFLALGFTRLYGGLYIEEKGAFTAFMWTLVVEFFYVLSGIYYGLGTLGESFPPLIPLTIFFIWSAIYYRRTFLAKG